MKLGTSVFLGATALASLGLATAGLAAMTVQGCSSSSSGGGTPATGGGTQPPAKPNAPATTSTDAHNFALHTIHLGDENNGEDWKKYGYNIDGKISDSHSTDVCTLQPNANKKNQADGPGGIDNSFGENIVGLISAVAANPSATISSSISKGSFTIMFDIVGLTGDATQTNTGLSGQLFGGVHFNQGPNAAAAVPTWTKSDNWPVGTDLLSGTTAPFKSTISFSDSYIVNGQFVNGAPTSAKLTLTIQGVALAINIKHAVITFNHSGTKAAGGIIAGVINTDELVNNLRGVAGNISTSLCAGNAFDQIATSIKEASDIMDDGTNAGGSPCNAISVGIGFDADEIDQPKVIGQPTVGANACVDGGAPPADAGTQPDTGTPPSDSGSGNDSGSGDASTD